MAIGKGLGGWTFNSQALIADAFHALTDLVSDFMTLGTVAWALKPPTPRFPSGYGKIESLGSLGVSGLLLSGGVLMCLNSCNILCDQFLGFELLHALHSHSHGIPDWNAAWLAGGSIIVKEWLYRSTIKIARERKSSILASNAVHHRIDSLTSIVALIAITGSRIYGVTWLDPVGGLIVSMMVIRAGWGNTRAALLELADVGIDTDTKASVRKAALKATDTSSAKFASNKIDVRDVQGVKAGQNYMIDIELGVPETLSIAELRPIEEIVRQKVGSQVRGVRRVKIRFVSNESHRPDFSDEFIGRDISARTSPEPDDEKQPGHVHEHHEHSPNEHPGKRD
ncbi:MAG: mitochondrial metal transporter [Heterodermia speciosa]|uniref:Mitochondrial metal transporter n=1 Tax=Heterodermia speciosa TaxID=116794 RepID=A0A8H3EDA2_9LECA|nr:MAG: mitochondrial metal transporter [Heterodermia speciosa]